MQAREMAPGNCNGQMQPQDLNRAHNHRFRHTMELIRSPGSLSSNQLRVECRHAYRSVVISIFTSSPSGHCPFRRKAGPIR